MQYEIQDKIFINDQGNQVKYKRLVVTGYVDGNVETLELPISRDQATIYRLMKGEGHEVQVRKATPAENPEVKRNIIDDEDNSGLFDD